ncbi:MAG: WYL domain-containing protein [Deltaproteobacteria bacterium]|nr:WYL domain-containing protein [Deltaproteobacteria bacterium]
MSDKVTRVIRLLQLFHRRGRVAKRDMVDALELDKKTVSRDLQALIEAGVPITPEGEGREQRWVLDERERHAGVVAGTGDMAALHLGRQMLGFLKGTAFSEYLEDLEGRLDQEGRDEKRARQSRIILREEPAREHGAQQEIVDELIDGVLKTRVMTLHYPSHYAEGVRAWPLTLMVYRRALYLIAWLPHEDRLRTFSVDRLEDATCSREHFTYPREYSVDSYLGDTFGIWTGSEPAARVRVRFEASRAYLVRARIWHPGQTLEELPGGDVVLSFHATGVELVRWVLEWGDKAEVLEPAWLRERVVAELRGALAKYPA